MFLPLHGRLTSYEQRRVFATDAYRAGTNITKIIFSTRIAETAVTINDVSVVIDIGYDRDYVYDQSKRLTMNMQQQITQAQANQRAGRAGRTRPGVCYRIYSQEDFEQMEQYKIPELKRISLDQAVLKLKQFNIDNVLGFDFIERPDDQALKQAIDSLKLLGALDDNEKITHLGEQMGMLPTDPAISRVVIEAITRECEQEVCKIIALMSFSGNLFFRGRSWEAWETSDRRKYDFCHPSGDLMTFLKIFENWEFYRGKNQMRRGWCFINTLNVKSLQQAEELFEELKVIAQTIKSRNSKFRSFFGATTTITDKKKQSENSQTTYLNDVQNLIDDLKQEEVAEKAQQNEDSELDEMSQLFFEVHREISKEISSKRTDSKIQKQITENDSIQFALEEDFFKPKSSNLFMKNSTESNDQTEKIQYPEYLELDKKSTDILQSFLCAYFPNIALHSGSEKLGYTFLRENRLIRLHGASSLSLQGVRPKWIMCGEIQVMQDYNCTKIASYIDINWIKNLIPPKFLQKYNIIELDVHPIYKDSVFSNLSSHVMQSFKLGKGELLQKMKEKFNVSIEENSERNEICVWASQEDIKEATKMTEEIIEDYIKLSKRETIERSVVQSGLVRVIIGAGAEVKDVLLGDEFRKLTFAKMPFKNETSATKFFNGFGLLEWVEVRKTPHSLLSQGEVVFRDAAQAKQAYDAFKDKYDVRPSTAKGRIVTPNIKVVFKWFTGRSNNRGMIRFETREIVTQILDELSDKKELFKALLDELEDNKKTKLSRGHKVEQSIMVDNLSDFVDDVILKKAFKKIFPDHRILTATVFRSETMEDFCEEHDVKIGKKIDPRTDEKEVSEHLNLVLDRIGSSEDIMKLEFLPTITNNNDDKKAKFRRRAELVTKNEEVAKKLVQYLNNKVEIRSHSRLHVEIKRSRTLRLDTSTFQVVKDQLEMQIEDLIAKLGDKIEISILGAEGNKKYYRKTKGSHKNPALRISSDNKVIMEHVMCEFQKTLLGDIYYLNTTAEYKKLKQGENFRKKIESEYKVKLTLFNREKQLKIVGSSFNVARAKAKITEFLSLKNETEKVIDFKRLNMSKLLRNETALLNAIEKSFSKVIFDLRLSGKKLILIGTKDAVDKAEAEIMKHVSEFNQNDNQYQEVDKKCTLCYDDIVQGYKLEFCGHKLCLKCLEAHIKQSIYDIRRFPINCPSCDKQPVPISQADLRTIVPENILAKLWQNSFKNFIAKNAHKYRTCPGFGCENIYLINDSDKSWVNCAICSMRYCRKCQKLLENLAESDDDNDESQSREPDDCKYCADDLLSISSFHSDDDMYSYD